MDHLLEIKGPVRETSEIGVRTLLSVLSPHFVSHTRSKKIIDYTRRLPLVRQMIKSTLDEEIAYLCDKPPRKHKFNLKSYLFFKAKLVIYTFKLRFAREVCYKKSIASTILPMRDITLRQDLVFEFDNFKNPDQYYYYTFCTFKFGELVVQTFIYKLNVNENGKAIWKVEERVSTKDHSVGNYPRITLHLLALRKNYETIKRREQYMKRVNFVRLLDLLSGNFGKELTWYKTYTGVGMPTARVLPPTIPGDLFDMQYDEAKVRIPDYARQYVLPMSDTENEEKSSDRRFESMEVD